MNGSDFDTAQVSGWISCPNRGSVVLPSAAFSRARGTSISLAEAGLRAQVHEFSQIMVEASSTWRWRSPCYAAEQLLPPARQSCTNGIFAFRLFAVGFAKGFMNGICTGFYPSL